MGYLSGVANSVADLVAAVNTAATLNGWTLASGILTKGIVNVRLSTQSSSLLKIEGANDSGFTAVCPWYGNVVLTTFPVAYRIFTATAPDSVFVHIREANLAFYQYLMFGAIENKVGTWNGGNFFAASRSPSTINMASIVSTFNQVGYAGYMGGYGVHGAPFAGGDTSYVYAPGPEGMYCDFNGGTWIDGTSNSSASNHAAWPRFMAPVGYRNPNLWNNQAVLFHPHLYMPVAGGRFSRIGSLPHIRMVRNTNYETYDVITLGPDRWMVAPWVSKNVTNPEPVAQYGVGDPNVGHSGTYAVAIRYDGP